MNKSLLNENCHEYGHFVKACVKKRSMEAKLNEEGDWNVVTKKGIGPAK